MNIPELAKRLASQYNAPRAERYNLWLREFDNMVELVGLVPDPNYDMRDFVGKEMMFPKRWVTLDVFDANMKV
jgi:hypothetical protein